MRTCEYHAFTGLGDCPQCAKARGGPFNLKIQNPLTLSSFQLHPDSIPITPRAAIPTPIAEQFAYNNTVSPDAMRLIRLLEQDRARLIGLVHAFAGVSRSEFNELIAAGMPETLIEHARSQCRTFEECNSKFPLNKVVDGV